MKLVRGITTAGLCAALLAAAACRSGPPDDPKDYVARLVAIRADKDAQFQSSNDPIPAARKAEFLPLSYYPVDPEYHVLAGLKPSEVETKLMMPTSSGRLRQMRRVGTLEFTLHGQQMSLGAFTETDLNHLTVMFSDATSGTETYPAGRYIELTRTATGIYELDFNLAFNPYCYYNVSYECPYPPPENRLKVPIRAGERIKAPESS